MFIAGVISLLEIDLKKVIALSTLRQLGFMGRGLGMGLFNLVFFHIMSHALVKRAFFILVGVFLHACFSTQEKRLMRVRSSAESWCFRGFVICSLALCGLGFTRGFISKEAILFRGERLRRSCGALVVFLLVVSFTLVYCGRILSAGVQSVLSRELGVGGSTKTVRRRASLLFLRVCRA